MVNSDLSSGHLVRRLLALSWEYRAGCIKVLVLQVVLLAIGLSGLGLTGLGIDYVRSQVSAAVRAPHWPFGWQPPADWSSLGVVGAVGGAILGLAALRAGLNFWLSISVADLIQRKVVVELRARVYDKLQRLSFRFYDANASGSIINRVTGDVQSTRLFIDGVVLQAVIMALSLAVYLVYMVSINPGLTLACLATTPLLWVATTLFSRVVRPAYARNRELVDQLILTLSESVQGIPVIKGFAREPETAGRFATANREVRDQQQRIFWQVSLFTPAISFLTQLNLVILLGYGGYLVMQDRLALGGGLLVFAGLLQQFSGQVANIANIANSVQESLTGARRVFEVLDAPIEVRNPPVPVRLPRPRGAIRFEHVWFKYREADTVLEDVDFEVAPGQCVAIVGPTGAGKSALMSLIPRFYDPRRGTVRLDGHDLRTLDLDELRSHIGIVFQESFLFSNTVAANIAFGRPAATRAQIERAARVAAAHEFIAAMPEGYETVLREGGSNLSGGQRQRLAIARALLLEPAVLLLDDPTAAIDPATEHEILQAMDQAMEGRTTFVVAHRLSTLRRADVILVLDHGRIVQRGTHAELVRAPGHYQELARLQLLTDDRVLRAARGAT